MKTPSPTPEFGGPSTAEKLEIVEAYLDIYTTAMKNQPWKLVYVDAFAVTGEIRQPGELIVGSARRALAVGDRHFDRLVFIEKDKGRCRALEELRKEHSSRTIEVVQGDANDYLQNLKSNARSLWRGVLFLDPFGAQVEWKTIERVAGLYALDCWILFPTSTIQRMLPRSRQPDDIVPGWVDRLNLVYGDDGWRSLYRRSSQRLLFGEPAQRRGRGTEGLLRIYKKKFRDHFGSRFLDRSRTLRSGGVSFELLFLVGNEAGIEVTKRIATYSLEGRR